MKKYLLLFLSVWICCFAFSASAHAGSVPQVAWEFKGAKGGKVFLVVEGKKHQVISKAIAPYARLERKEFESYGIPTAALVAAYSWHAGFGDVLYVKSKGGKLEVYQQEMDESETSHYPLKKILVISP